MRRTLTALAATAALTILPAAPALAHVEQTQGDLTIAVGFATEPAYAGQPNAVQLLVSRHEQPVTDLAPGRPDGGDRVRWADDHRGGGPGLRGRRMGHPR